MKKANSASSLLIAAFFAVIVLQVILSYGNNQNSSDEKGTKSAALKRPFILNNTLVASDSSLLRGGTFWIYGWIPDKTTWALSDKPWQAMQDNHLNIVRVACAYRPERAKNYSLEQYEGFLDNFIDRAEKLGIYVMIDYHPKPGTYDMTNARAFWTRFASRYKDRENVIYELTNEPKFSQPENYTDQNLRDFEGLWQLTNKLAPKTPIVIMSFCQVGNTGRTPKQVTDGLQGIDWSKTVVGFHSYWRDSSERIVELKKYYPCINTEFHTIAQNSRNKEMQVMDGYRWHGTLMEKLGISWTQWDVLDRQPNLQNLDSAIIDLKTKGYYWKNKN